MNHFAAQFRSQLNEGERDPSTTRRAYVGGKRNLAPFIRRQFAHLRLL